MISALLVMFAGIFKACSDKLTFHYEKSIFIEFENQHYWNPVTTWDSGLGFLSSGLNLFKMLWSSCFVLAIVFYEPGYNWLISFILLKAAYDLFYKLFWKHVLDVGFYD